MGTAAPVTLGPGQPQLHSIQTKACFLDSLWDEGVCCLLYPYLPNPSSRPAHTCFDLLRRGPHSLSGPCCLPQPGLQAKTFLGWRCLRQQKVKTNLLRLAPSWACSSPRPQQTGQRPLAYPLQPFILPTLQMLARRGASPGWGRADSTLLLPRARRGAPTSVSQALRHTPCTTSWPHTKFLSGVSSILLQ